MISCGTHEEVPWKVVERNPTGISVKIFKDSYVEEFVLKGLLEESLEELFFVFFFILSSSKLGRTFFRRILHTIMQLR